MLAADDPGTDAVQQSNESSSFDIALRRGFHTEGTTASSTDKDDSLHRTSPPESDVRRDDVSGKMADDWVQQLVVDSSRVVTFPAAEQHRPVNAWVQQLVDVSSMLSRFITLEYFCDGAALTKCLAR